METVIEREKKLKSELKKKENDLKSELENSKVCSASKVSLQFFFKRSFQAPVCQLVFLGISIQWLLGMDY